MKFFNIAILGSRGIPARYGGFETFAEHLSVGLAQRGHNIFVYCPKYQQYRAETYKNVNLVFITNFEYLFKGRITRAFCNLLYDITCIFHACSLTNLSHIYMLGYSAGPFLGIPRLFNKKIIVNPDGLEWKSTRWGLAARSWLYLSELICAKFSNQLICDAVPISNRFDRKYKARTITVEYGTELYFDDGKNLEYPKNSYYLAVARMVPETKIDIIISGFKKAETNGKKLIIVGPVTDKNYFESQILPFTGKDNIEYLGSIYDNIRLKKLRSNAFALIHGHASDGTNPSLLESMGCSSPVIAIDRESNVKVLTRENALYFVDEASLAQTINNFENMESERRIKMGDNNLIRVRDNFSWDNTVKAHEEVFTSLS